MPPTAHRWPLSVPVLSDGVVTLRAHTPADVDPMAEMANDPLMRQWTAISVPHTREMSEEFALFTIPQGWDEGRMRGWAIEAVDDTGAPRYAGNVDIRGQGPVTDIGYVLHPWARGRGLMSRAVRLAVNHVLTEEGVEVVHWRARVGNEASLRVAHRCGFTIHGMTPGLLVERGEVHDAWTASYRFGDTPLPSTPWAESVVLESDRVRLRPFRDGDAARVVEACSDPETRLWLNGLPSPYTAATARAYLHDCIWRAAAGLKATWAVADSATDELVGNIAVMDLGGLNPTTAEIGYWTHPAHRGRGLTTEAVRLVADHALDEHGLGLRRLSLLAAARNRASQRVAEKNGFQRVGLEREAELLGDGTVDDLVCFDRLRSS